MFTLYEVTRRHHTKVHTCIGRLYYTYIGRPIGMTAEEVKGVWRHDQND